MQLLPWQKRCTLFRDALTEHEKPEYEMIIDFSLDDVLATKEYTVEPR